jgi:DNA-binding SARP family transcriptional activator
MVNTIGGMEQLSARARTPVRSSLELEAFREFPYAMLVLDGRGRVICRNREAARLIQARGLAEGDLSCCTLFGCRRPETVLAAACLSELALAHDGALPEMRVDIATPEGPSAIWIAAGRIGRAGAGAERIGVHLRPGLPNDRRERTGRQKGTEPRLRIATLGKTVVESAEGELDGAWLEQRTGQVFKYLVAARHRSVAVEEIGESIWPGADYAIGASVRYYVHALRRKLEPQRGLREQSAFIAAGCGSYRLNLEHVVVDADEFEAHLTAGLACVERDPKGAAAQIERALAIYRGDFLAELPYAEWTMLERHRLHELACAGLNRLAEIRMELRLIDGAARSLERLATLQPYDEDVHRRLMEIDIMRGRRSDAVRRYASLRSRLRRTFGHDPAFTPADLAHPRPFSSGPRARA